MNRVAVVTLVAVAVSAGLAGAQEPPDPGQGRVVSYDEAQALVIQNSFELKLADEDIRDAQRRVKRARRQYHPRIKVQGTARGDLLFRRYIPGTKGQPHTTIKGAGHFLQEDQGEIFANVILEFVRRNP